MQAGNMDALCVHLEKVSVILDDLLAALVPGAARAAPKENPPDETSENGNGKEQPQPEEEVMAMAA